MLTDGKRFADTKQVEEVVRHDVLHVSYSQLKSYLLCPERYRQGYVCARPPSHRSSEMVLGSALHDVLATHHEHIRQHGERTRLALLQDELEGQLTDALNEPVPILWQDDEAPEKLWAQAKQLLALYYDEVDVGRVIAVEQRFYLPSSAWPVGAGREEQLTGAVDLIEQGPDGVIYIVELKTAARRFDDNRLTFDPQLGLYASARGVLGVPEARLRYRVLLKTKKPAIVTYDVHRSESDIRECFELMSAVLRAIECGVFYRQRGWQCDTCPFRATCGD